ncbi:ribosomal protein S18 acetylase RimI-like enzyme [Streptosporangium becharense]|uniref:Ribosomal protein S18 acetylase RimI-like enzyme n=1 Tax=Streptosporangium becharense TaxID=1816182 RepID=A0A7W9MIG3_9ACTN|nr:GNAT family N-acetyltransferase [Streptosporangium becharense]MBB2913209.1 ribosomal protein S18 acetylase RimI-like enzyme [Streptosporangium becharense]MBB5822192.1 ribosomal protein S18 acetylase RimI-like enzyme [Streptosporangium becharense]
MANEVFDRLVDRAWPAIERVDAGGWSLRAAAGVTKRANSVLPLGERADLAAAIGEAEEFYADRGLPCVFSVGGGAPSGLDAALEARGYRVVDPTLVMTAPLDHGTAAEDEGVELAEAPSQAWLDAWWSVDGRFGDDGLATAARILTGVPATYASLDGQAVGRGVVQGEWFGVYCMAVVPHARRSGLGGRVLRALLSHARRQGTRRAYMVVVESNAVARSLYERQGFAVAGRYHYRVR